MLNLKKVLLGLTLITGACSSYAVEMGGTLPDVSIPTKGELLLNKSKVTYKNWSSSSIQRGSPALIFHMAARMSSDKIIAPLRERLEKEDFTPGSFQSISVVNIDDALWGTSGLVSSEMEKNKRAHPEAILVADDGGRGLKAWQLKKGDVAVMLLDAKGEIRYLKEGSLSSDDINTIIGLLNTEIARVASN
ncbi:YtfJ family protein [Zhongshania guokunii]|uniref:YtfJ family protein n=1 Tax=Zhongshania guokunii TaxID=641783 RepID=A0ABV3U6J5_9GAMM